MHIEDFFQGEITPRYFAYISSIKRENRGSLKPKTKTGFEKHHIYIKSFRDGKIDEEYNLVWLTSEEHLRAHIMLLQDLEKAGERFVWEKNKSERAVDWMFKTNWKKLSDQEKILLEQDIPNIAQLREKAVHAKKAPESVQKTLKTKRETGVFNITEEHRKHLSESHKGKKRTPEAIEKFRQKMLGHPLWSGEQTEEKKKRIAETMKKVWQKRKELGYSKENKVSVSVRNDVIKYFEQ